ncbi:MULTISPECIES: phage tail terminator protein [Bacillus]|jgi:hypothetical protein|uniref:phage tail terminator protein n=1 Tax=Bacillus TaxID=1386 RepID=UPI00119CFE72|nr:minor capsid protein [Bacillus mycoides]HDR7617035.1 minor capsid protein [Bacillus mycoides]
MKWLIESVIKHLNTLPQSVIFARIKANNLDVGTDGKPRKSIAVRIIPSVPGEQYFDGETIRKQFQILVKSENELEAMESIDAIAEALHNSHRRTFYSIDSSYTLISLVKYVEPNFVDRNAANESIFTTLFTTELVKGG